VANVVVGAFSILLMKRTGYALRRAVEAADRLAAFMLRHGAQAFIMVQYTGVADGKICLYSLVPALLYYGA
jgi:TRAP-type uncharacterized transport system fused permease subunit